MPSDVKEKLNDYIRSDMHDKIATEKDVTSVDEMMVFLREHHHPVLARASSAEIPPADITGLVTDSTRTIHEGRSLPPAPGTGVSITFHNVRLHADRVFVRKGRK
jgi:acetyl-CoA decarbonylase/synthase complex subunit beta